jgi:hypothetical protein
MYIYMYIYIYIERERERELKLGNAKKYGPLSALKNPHILFLSLLNGVCSVIMSVNLKRHAYLRHQHKSVSVG